jgi:hypothetical protein
MSHFLSNVSSSQFTVNRAPNVRLVLVPQFRRQQRLGKILVTGWMHESLNRRRTNRRESGVASRGIRPAMMHGRANLDAGRVTIPNYTAYLRSQNLCQSTGQLHVWIVRMQSCRELAFQLFGKRD